MANNSDYFLEDDLNDNENDYIDQDKASTSSIKVNKKVTNKGKKSKNPSFTSEYFEQIFDSKTGDDLRICKILDEDGNQCKKTYQNTGSSTGNLIQHLDEVHKIVSKENDETKKVYTDILCLTMYFTLRNYLFT